MTKSPFYVDPGQLTPLDAWRAQLSRLGNLVGQLGYGLGDTALEIPPLLDQIVERLEQLHAEGISLPGEEAQLETAQAELRRKLNVLLREAGGASKWEQARRARQPAPDLWWWFPDRIVADERKAAMRRALQGMALVAVVLGVVYGVYVKFLAPDPAFSSGYMHEKRAQTQAQRGNLTGALAEIEQAIAVWPGNPEWLVLKGVLQQALGQTAAAEVTFAAAQPLFNSPSAFLLARAQNWMAINSLAAALADAQAAVALEPDSALGNLILAQAYEQAGKYREALDAYQLASDLADVQQQPQIAVMARTNIGMLSQRLMFPPTRQP